MDQKIEFMTKDKVDELEQELKDLKTKQIPSLAKRIDEARQMGDLSENAEYHSAREDMAWVQSRVKEIKNILDNSQVISHTSDGIVQIGSTIKVKTSKMEREYTIVGPQEADPLSGKISNESPLGNAFLGKKTGDKVQIALPAGVQEYKIVSVI